MAAGEDPRAEGQGGYLSARLNLQPRTQVYGKGHGNFEQRGRWGSARSIREMMMQLRVAIASLCEDGEEDGPVNRSLLRSTYAVQGRNDGKLTYGYALYARNQRQEGKNTLT